MTATPPASGDEVTTVLDVVDTLEELVGAARRVPFTTTVVVNEEEILELVDRIRVSLPDDLRSARDALDERDEMLERAGREAAETIARAAEEAERVVREARAEAERLVADHAIVATATEHARDTVEEADRHAAAQRAAADDYAREVMRRLEEQLERWLGTVREGLSALPAAETAAPPRRRRR